MLDVSPADCGEWIPGYSNPREEGIFLINVISLAVDNGFSTPDSWDTDGPILRADVADRETFLRAFSLYDDALVYLQDLLPEGFWFEAESWGLYLLTTSPDGNIVGY